MNTLVKKTSVILLFSLLVGCVGVKTQHLTYFNQLNPDETSRLRMDGYFFCNYQNANRMKSDTLTFIKGFFLFKNGFVKGGKANIYKSQEEFLRREGITNEIVKQLKNNWGSYIISGDTIKIQQLEITRTSFTGGLIDVIEQRGKILNDTTIHIFEQRYGREVEKDDQVYHFRQYSPKPDSSNWLMSDEKLLKRSLKK